MRKYRGGTGGKRRNTELAQDLMKVAVSAENKMFHHMTRGLFSVASSGRTNLH